MFPIINHVIPTIIGYKMQNINQMKNEKDADIVKLQTILSNFSDISKIYRESGHCQEISEYLTKRLTKDGFTVNRNPNGSICATRDLNNEENNAIILQAHMDMVAESSDGNSKKPIETHIKDGWLYANDRTLGADDGIGVAAILTVAESVQFKNYPFEMIITTDEETSMTGARALSIKDFKGEYLINLDSEEFGILTKGCAGIAEYSINENIKTAIADNNNYKKLTIKISGGKGGHSALVTENYFNPIKALITEINKHDYKLVSIKGGEKFNTVPTWATAEIIVPQNQSEAIKKSFETYLSETKKKNSLENPNIEYSIADSPVNQDMKYLEPKAQKLLLNNLSEIPIGLISKYSDSNLNKTSQNLGAINISNGVCQLKIMGRSSDKKEGENLRNKTSKILSQAFGKPISPSSTSPIWEAKLDCLLENTAVKAFNDIEHKNPSVVVEHGGLESAVFAEKCPNLEQISIGPTLRDPHSTKECLKLDTVLPFFDWLSRIIEELPKG